MAENRFRVRKSKVEDILFDTTITPIDQVEGLMQWNETDGTLDLTLQGGNVTQQIGQELLVKCRNDSDALIENGTPVYISGRQGNRPKIFPARSDVHGTAYVFGVATEDIADNSDGYVTTFGYVRQIKTNYSGTGDWGSTWQESDNLYVSKTVSGQLTNVEPDPPHHSDVVGQVGVVGSAGVGSIFINIRHHTAIEELSDVNGTPLTTNGQLMVWNNSSGYFDFDYNINDYATTGDLSSYATIDYVTGVSGDLQSQIDNLDAATGGYIPYVGATSSVDLGNNSLTVGSDLTVTGNTYITGNLGIGASPSYPLHVNGEAYIDTSVNGSNGLTINQSSNYIGIDVNDGTYRAILVDQQAQGVSVGAGYFTDSTSYVILCSPSYGLEVNGDSRFSNSALFEAGIQLNGFDLGGCSSAYINNIYADAGGNHRIDIQNKTFYDDAAQNPSFDWENRILYDFNGNSVIDYYGSTYAIDISGSANVATSLNVGTNCTIGGDGFVTGNLGVGTSSPSANIHSLNSSEQLRLGYDEFNYLSFTVDSAGELDIDSTNGEIRFNYSAFIFEDSANHGTRATLSSNDLYLGIGSSDAIVIEQGGPYVAIKGTPTTSYDFEVFGTSYTQGDADFDDNVNITSALDVGTNCSIGGHLSAATKSFLIDNPTKEGKKLQYGVVESDQHSVFVRGKTDQKIIKLPEEWEWLVHEDSVTVQLTPFGKPQQLYIIEQNNKIVHVGGVEGEFNYTIYGERKDVAKLETEV